MVIVDLYPFEKTVASGASHEDIIEKIVPEQELIPAITNTDTVAGDARRDEYFKGVHIIIEDQYRKVFINI